MVSPQSTTRDWELFSGKVAVLPVGSLEQHAEHLPLDTDIVEAAHFAKLLAEDLGAALLPVLPFGTCAEHTGFRGSISLRPETHMQLVRDIADELELQNFEVLILLNGHGGNFAIGPAARWINRADRKLKVLIVNWWEFVPPGILEAPPGEIHAGELETSVMMVLAPDTVRTEAIPVEGEVKLPPTAGQLKQADLNVFGTGYFNPEGYVGYPWLGSKAKGEAVIAGVRAEMAAHVRQRLELLRKNPSFTGPGGVSIRPLEPGDVEAGMRLKAAAGWNQTERDWEFLLGRKRAGFAAVRNGEVLGTVTTLNYAAAGTWPRVSWIGMMLVDPAARGGGIGRKLMEEAIRSVPDGFVIGLDATSAGRPLYEKLGFQEVSKFARMVLKRKPLKPIEDREAVRALRPEDLEKLAQMDAEAFGTNRVDLLAELIRNEQAAWGVETDGRLVGGCVGRPGSHMYQIGPILAGEESQAKALVWQTLAALGEGALVLDVPLEKAGFVGWLEELGFQCEREFVRMILGKPELGGNSLLLWAIAGPELG